MSADRSQVSPLAAAHLRSTTLGYFTGIKGLTYLSAFASFLFWESKQTARTIFPEPKYNELVKIVQLLLFPI